MKKLQTKEWIAIAVAIIFGLIFVFGFRLPFGRSEEVPSETFLPTNLTQTVQIQDIAIGTGEVVAPGKQVSIHYVGQFENGQKFDSSRDRGQPFSFIADAGFVIPGFDQGIRDMRVGGVRRVTIPPELGYGPSGVTNPQTGEVIIPPNATLIFEIELLGVEDLRS